MVRSKFLVLVLAMSLVLLISGLMVGCNPEEEEVTGGDTITVVDLAGREVEIVAPAKKVVAIGPGALRLVCYVNGAEKIVGIEELEKNSLTGRGYFMANPSLKDLPTIGPGGPDSIPDAEKLVSIQPDVIFSCFFLDKAKADDLQNQTGVPVLALDYGTDSTFSQEIMDSLQLIGKVTGEEKKAQEVVDFLKGCYKDLDDRTKDIPDNEKPTVYVGGLSMKGAHGIESSYVQYPPLRAVNARNVVDEVGKEGSVSIDREQLVVWDPEILFIDAGGLQLVRDDYQKNPDYYESLSAVKSGRIYSLVTYNWYWTNIDTAVADAYYAGKVIYPDKFEDIDPVKKADEIYKAMLGKEMYQEMLEKDEVFVGFKQISLN
ncbi:MAG: iron ABC transporter substrate-binding protein [Firmicutes bacterium]|nr:iron ABC transporter substrate-binding protein [Bacillota bacterium]